MQTILFSFTKVTFTSALLEATAYVSQCDVVMNGHRHKIGWRICLDYRLQVLSTIYVARLATMQRNIYSFLLVVVQFNDL